MQICARKSHKSTKNVKAKKSEPKPRFDFIAKKKRKRRGERKKVRSQNTGSSILLGKKRRKVEKKDDVLWPEEKSAPWREESSRACFHWKSEGGSPHCQICKNMPYSRPCGEAQRLLPKPAEGPRACWSRWQMRLDQLQIAADWMAQALDVPVRKADRGGSVHLPLAPKVVQSQGRPYDQTPAPLRGAGGGGACVGGTLVLPTSTSPSVPACAGGRVTVRRAQPAPCPLGAQVRRCLPQGTRRAIRREPCSHANAHLLGPGPPAWES